MKRDYPRRSWQEFSELLITTEDLDPIYVILHEAHLPEITLKRWLLAYWCFYHAGVASRLAESPKFYETGYELYFSAPRGFERRHFRGGKGQDAWAWLSTFAPEVWVDSLIAPTFAEVSERVQEWPQFGPWIAWKVGDMLERVLGEPVDFSQASLHIYDEPKKGAALIRFGDYTKSITPHELDATVQEMLDYLGDLDAPPRFDRKVNIQEIETCLCKYKAHHKGFYPLYNDLHEVGKALDGWGDLAQQLKAHLPANVWRSENNHV